ncbi:MAG: radical SAM/SPASM domain-containing protein [Phycisphaerae bacterium]
MTTASESAGDVSVWTKWKLSAAVKAAGFALRVPVLREAVVYRAVRAMNASYDVTEDDPERMRHVHWLWPHLAAFLRRLVRERPAAARAMLRILGTWAQDLVRRTELQREGMAAPLTVVIEPTDRCNLSCPGCYAKSGSDGSDLPYELMEQIVRQVIDMGTSLITISGGEPFLREKADRTISRLGERFRDQAFLVYTNGTLIDDQTAHRLAEAGNIFPAISVEGSEQQTDARRGGGTYRRNRLARELLARRGVMCGFSATVTRENCRSICDDRFIEQRIAEGDLFGWFFLLQPIGRSPRPDLMVTAEQRALLRETVKRWRSEDRPIFLGDFWNDGHFTGGCIAGGRYYFHIYANGDLSPCVFAPVACGNIFDIIQGRSQYRDLRDFVQRNPVFRAYRDEQKAVKDRNRPCLIIDHPEAFRRISRLPMCRPAKNMAEGYVDGQIGQAIDQIAARWRETSERLPMQPFVEPRPEHGARA